MAEGEDYGNARLVAAGTVASYAVRQGAELLAITPSKRPWAE